MEQIEKLIKQKTKGMNIEELVSFLNNIKIILKEISPFKKEPVDCVLWIKAEDVTANDYNPNTVAPPEMILLETSIKEDGYTQPIVSWKNGDKYEVVDGFHRNRVGKESEEVKERIKNYLPLSIINKERATKTDRMASTIRHNRARGKHRVDAMSDIVLELKNRNWTNSRISKQLGMDEDEILRLCQITGLAGLFSDDDFSRSWDIENSSLETMTFEKIDDCDISDGDEKTITMNTSDKNRIFHTYDKWECFKHGFYATTLEGKTKKDCEQEYYNVLTDKERFKKALNIIINEWKNSCEHYLTNNSMNRIAWLGQAAVCLETKVPCVFSSGWQLLSSDQQDDADNIALEYLNYWLKKNGLKEATKEEAKTNRTSTLY